MAGLQSHEIYIAPWSGTIKESAEAERRGADRLDLRGFIPLKGISITGKSSERRKRLAFFRILEKAVAFISTNCFEILV
jgi:hypothetical protein